MSVGRALTALALATLVIGAQGAWGQARGPRPGPTSRPAARPEKRTLDYVDGLEALEAGDYPRAVASFTRAIAADDDNADYHRARGVANVLAEAFPAAIADLERALRLEPGDREARLWLMSALRMANERDPKRVGSCFVHGGDVPASYADLVCNRMAMDYWGSRYNGMYRDREARRTVRVTSPVKTSFPDAAREYAARHKGGGSGPAGGEAAGALLARMKASFERGDCPAAMRDLAALRRESPDDVQLRAYWGVCLLRLGDAWHAREELTRTLTAAPLWPGGYLARAEAAAILGDERRATADLQVATTLQAPNVDAVRAKVTGFLAPRPPDDAVERFGRSVGGDAPWPALVDAALSVERWSGGRRLRYDEAYQDRIRVLSEAVRDEPRNPDAPEMLARFLLQHHVVPEVWNGPRGGGEPLRPQSPTERQREMSRALEAADAALRVNRRHVNAMATKALILVRVGRAGEAEGLADQGLAIEPRNVRLLQLKAEAVAARAGTLASQATALRMGHTETYREQRSDGEYEVRKHYPPTAADLSRAAALEAQAAALMQEVARLTAAAKRVESEVIPGLVKDGEARLARGDARGARRALEQAWVYNPDTPGLLSHLAEVFGRLGDTRKQRLFALLAEPMRHTTAADPLKLAWQEAARTAWRSAGEALDRAAAIDPADARIPAYRSVAAAGAGDLASAQRQRRAALALEEARARLTGTTFAGDGGPVALPEVGLTIIVRLGEGRAALAAHHPDRAAEAFGAVGTLERRAGKEHLVDLVPSAMLPDPAAEAGTVPEAPSLASLASWARLGAARAWIDLGKPDAATREYRAVRAYGASWPATAKGRETMYVVDSWARLGLAEAAMAAGDHDEAFRVLVGEGGFPGRLPADLEAQRKALTERVFAARRGR